MKFFDILKAEKPEITTDPKASSAIEENLNLKERMHKVRANRNTNPAFSEDTLTPRSNTDHDIFTNHSQNVRITKPKDYNDVATIAQQLKDGKIVILNMDKVEAELAIKIWEFLQGVCFALGCEPDSIDTKIFLIDPSNQRIK